MAAFVVGDFDTGDTVCLNSGGPDMTVTDVRRGWVYAVWFDGAEMRGDWFRAACVKPGGRWPEQVIGFDPSACAGSATT